VELNSGDVFVRSEKGQGTSVHVTIPNSGVRETQAPILL
jgi:signal transduction histidine kinase